MTGLPLSWLAQTDLCTWEEGCRQMAGRGSTVDHLVALVCALNNYTSPEIIPSNVTFVAAGGVVEPMTA